MEFLNSIWGYIIGALGGVSLAGVISTIIYACLKAGFSKAISKINYQKIADDATDKGIERVKSVTFKHNIEPLVKSEMVKVAETVNETLTKELAEMRADYAALLTVMSDLAAYFDNSIGVSDEAKAKLHADLEKAQKPVVAHESVETESVEIEPTVDLKKATVHY